MGDRGRKKFFAGGWIMACVGWVAVSWVIPNTAVGALAVIGMMVGLLMRWERGHRHWSGPHGAMDLMTASMVGMVGGTLVSSLRIGVHSFLT